MVRKSANKKNASKTSKVPKTSALPKGIKGKKPILTISIIPISKSGKSHGSSAKGRKKK